MTTETVSGSIPDGDLGRDHTTRVHDARGACQRCIDQVPAVATPLLATLETDLRAVLASLAADVPTPEDFERAIQLAQQIIDRVNGMQQQDASWYRENWSFRSDLAVLLENIQLAQVEPLGTREY